jgi:hypothetical protein
MAEALSAADRSSLAAEQGPVTMSVGGVLVIGVLSYDGGVHFGLLADRDLDPPPGAVRAALEDAMNGRFAPLDRG